MSAPKRWWLPAALAVGLLLTLAGSSSAYEIDYATYDALVTDVQGISTEVTDLGFWAGANVLTVRRGEATIEVPFRKVLTLEMGAYLPEKGHYPLTIVTRGAAGKAGKSLVCQVDRMEGQRILGAESDLGAYRIRLQQIRRLELRGLSHAEP